MRASEFFLDLVYAFAVLGIVEAVIKPVAKRIVQYKILKYGPLVLKALDPVMPDMISRYSSEELELIVREKFEEITGEDWSDINLNLYWRLYDPRKNADSIQPK